MPHYVNQREKLKKLIYKLCFRNLIPQSGRVPAMFKNGTWAHLDAGRSLQNQTLHTVFKKH